MNYITFGRLFHDFLKTRAKFCSFSVVLEIDSSTVEQSSDYNRHFVADLAIDGDNVTEYFGYIKGCSHTFPDNYNDYHWWRVMLDKPSVVSTVHYLYRNTREGKYRLQSTYQFAVLLFY